MTLKILKNANFADNRLSQKGFFWSNECDQNEVNKLMKRVLNISKKESLKPDIKFVERVGRPTKRERRQTDRLMGRD